MHLPRSCPKGTTRGSIKAVHVVHVEILLIASPVLVLAWLKEYYDDDEDEQDVLFGGFNHLPLWYFRGLL